MNPTEINKWSKNQQSNFSKNILNLLKKKMMTSVRRTTNWSESSNYAIYQIMHSSKNKTELSDKELFLKKDIIKNKQNRTMVEPTKSALEKHIDDVSKQIEIPLEKYETTPGVGNCWYEACASLMKLNNMRSISAKQLRKEVVDNIESCENFKNVFEMIF